jgi:hypothetical protein
MVFIGFSSEIEFWTNKLFPPFRLLVQRNKVLDYFSDFELEFAFQLPFGSDLYS